MKLTDFSPGQKRQALRSTLSAKLKAIRGVEVGETTHVEPEGQPNLSDDHRVGTKLRNTTDIAIAKK
ncbi:MAG: hypothetical protein GOVbin2277_27 [Prokaryotic dsDNA virus sp.]|jgi:hypothetical protein|nr:MAG: hypothetical protein GOVbin2277_27 [Prokaryotic dsDNA virus sp.]|tara:strand:- start:55 stop:255 length:201 start_codon:yes stop_codon:yes gene_type:complete